MDRRGDTIAAIATARASAALGIIRISGPQAGPILDAVMPRNRATHHPRQVVVAVARRPGSGAMIDRALCFFCPGPGTVTGEDTAEIQGHGGPLIMERLLQAVLDAGARLAEPGEFTYRGFLNGRMDLTQAEAVMGLISARSDRAARAALRQLEGGLGSALEAQLDELTRVAAQIEAGLDFPDEDLPTTETRELRRQLDGVIDRLTGLRDSFALGTRLTRGARIAIVGPPNAGKSSLLNRLVNEDRALVDHTPGTTRDVVEAQGEVGGIPTTFWDTAGMRSRADRLERRGIEKTIAAAAQADLVLAVIDGTAGGDQLTSGLHPLLRNLGDRQTPLVIAVNKRDLPTWRPCSLSDLPHPSAATVPVSALDGTGIEQLGQQLHHALVDDVDDTSVILTTQRQHSAVVSCLENATRAADLLTSNGDLELVAADLRFAMEALAVLWGKKPVDGVIETLFSSFCIGK